ncbi:MAG: hypothetical protein EPO32_12445 [Anaerolineae bacterium]|nr:MAG: hypothetical protein EPO32_12445 [Anaerolineae bacterium]
MTRKPEPEDRFHVSLDKKGNLIYGGKTTLKRGLALLLMLIGLWIAGADPNLRSQFLDFCLRLIAHLAGSPN